MEVGKGDHKVVRKEKEHRGFMKGFGGIGLGVHFVRRVSS